MESTLIIRKLDEMDRKIGGIAIEMKTSMVTKMELQERIDQGLGNLRNEMLNGFDSVLGSIHTLQQEHTTINYSLDRIEQKLDHHERRTQRLEKHNGLARIAES